MSGKTSNEGKTRYNAKACDRLCPFGPKGRKAKIQAAADAAGKTLNEFIVKAIDERMEQTRAHCRRVEWKIRDQAGRAAADVHSWGSLLAGAVFCKFM